jgi:hypothetical protein
MQNLLTDGCALLLFTDNQPSPFDNLRNSFEKGIFDYSEE